VSSDVLYASERTSVSRVPLPRGDGATAIRKEAHGGSAAARLRQEATALQRLAGVPGVPQLLEIGPGASWLLVTDSRGVALSDSSRGRDADPVWMVRFAHSLAEVVAGVHRRGVIHKDINPSNVLLSEGGAAVTLVDFDLATTFAEERPEFTHHTEVAGTLPYLAPEQTGRTGWAVDHRADLYALGATLYEVLTGRPPFGSDVSEPLQLIHAHLAKAPESPTAVNPAVPVVLSALVVRLLEKEPDQRYQSADGVAHDLARLVSLLADGASAVSAVSVEDFGLGDRDFPLRLSAPSRLVGRDAERAALAAAYHEARRGGTRGLLVSGAPGVGKSALLDELRLQVTEQGGWLVTGKFDKYRQDVVADAVPQAFMALGRLLLAEPEAELAGFRSRLLETLGPNAPLIGVWPEFATLLGVPPDAVESALAGDPDEVRARTYRACADVLRSVATPDRPVVMVLDDVQWAASFPIGAIDALLTDENLSGVLLVAAFREAEVDAAHPLSVMLERWQRLGVAPPQLRLRNLPTGALAVLLGEMLRLEPREAARLAEAVGARTAGNPFDTVELVNALRREGALVPDQAAGWRWDATTIRRFVGSSDVLDLLTARINHLPALTGRLLEIAACLGGEIVPDALAVAADLSRDDVPDLLAPALEDGLLVAVTGPGTGEASTSGTFARFRHDRVLEAAHDHLSADSRVELHLSLARRLAESVRWADLAAEQYLHAVAGPSPAVTDPAEARRAAGLFLAAGTKLRLVNAPIAERYLRAAAGLLEAVGTPPDAPLLHGIRRRLHAVLYTLGRLDDAERVYATIAESCDDPVDLVSAAGLHINCLVGRGRPDLALALGLGLLADLGVGAPPAEDLEPEIGRGLAELAGWVRDDLAGDEDRPEITDPRWRAAAAVIDKVMSAAFFHDPAMLAWLVLRSWRIWTEQGPCEHLVGAMSHVAMVTAGAQGDYRTGYDAVRRIVAVGEARGWEPATSQARWLLAVSIQAWFEPLENVAAETLRAREGCRRGGDVYNAAFTYVVNLPVTFDLLPTLSQFQDELETGTAFAARTGATGAIGNMAVIRQLARAVLGETHAPGGFTDDEFDEAAFLTAMEHLPIARFHLHAQRALSALLFHDEAALAEHARAAVDLTASAPGNYPLAVAHLAQGVALATRLRAGDGSGGAPDERDGLLVELDACRAWLSARGADAPVNFGHLATLLDAERAWAVGDRWAAALAFDAALSEVDRRPRPWQQALITERAAMFHLAAGMQATGNRLLAEAHHRYAAWGATGKVRELEAEHPFLRDEAGTSGGWSGTAWSGTAWSGAAGSGRARTGAGGTRGHTSRTSSESIDLLGVLRAAQALASETSLDRLRGRVVEVLTMMTGATGVQLAQWKDDAGEWFVPDDEGAAGLDAMGRLVTVDEAGARGLLPVSVFRYAERTGEPLRVEDATRDDRFARDPYLAGLDRCSLLVVPIQSHGRTRAMLVLENRLSRGAFSADRLDAVLLIAGQLAVCLDNALAERFRSLVQRSSELTLVCDGTGTVSYASTAAVELLGVEPTALVGRPVSDAVAADDRDGLLAWVAGAGAGEASDPLVCRLEPRDGAEWWAEATLTDLSSDPAVGGLMLRLRDVTERRRLERALEELAVTDSLTGVANRRRFDEALRAEAQRSLRAGTPLTLLLLDLDHFKAVNDTYGHPAGDAVLKAVAARCRSIVRDVDLVARVGGEEFAVLLVDVGLAEGEQVADRMRTVIEATEVPIPGHPPLSRTTSVGVAEFTGDATDLMARADAALYRAKTEGRNRVRTST
jgi:diguanylate cyclase (GGDEF)-like protein/PAS domain S-box-containing protein